MLHTVVSNSFTTHRDLLMAWTSRILKARYQQSVLGAMWAIAQPAASVAVFTVIFTQFVPISTDGIPYVLFSFAALAPWTFFTTSISEMVNSLTENMNLVTKIYFPREILPIACLLARFLDFVIAFAILVILMLYFKTPFYPFALVYIPIILGIQMALSLGLGLVGATLNVFFRDIKHLVELLLRILIYASPVIYPVSAIPEHLRPFYLLNPMAGIITAYRDVLLYERLPGHYLLISAITSCAILIFGYWFFKRFEFRFADVV